MTRLLAVLVWITVFISCTSREEKMLAKRWRVADVIFMEDAQAKAQNDTMQLQVLQRQRAVLKEVLMKNLYEFHKDGTYITGNAAATSTGEWKLGDHAVFFKSDAGKGGEEHLKRIPFERLSKDSFVLILNNHQASVNLKLVLLPAE